jgi:hypothetical protein
MSISTINSGVILPEALEATLTIKMSVSGFWAKATIGTFGECSFFLMEGKDQNSRKQDQVN